MEGQDGNPLKKTVPAGGRRTQQQRRGSVKREPRGAFPGRKVSFYHGRDGG